MNPLTRLPGIGGWEEDPAWASVYDWTVEHPRIGGLLWRVGIHSDLRKLYAATAEIGRLPAGSRVLDVPCGGGVGLRGVRPGQGIDYVAADIAPAMLARTRRAAVRRGVADQVTTTVADVATLPFGDASFDRVLTLTGLHCFPEPRAAIHEMARVLAPGGVLAGSALLNDTGPWHEHVRIGGRLIGVLGPGCTGAEVVDWLTEAGMRDVTLDRSGAIAYFRGVRGV